MKERLQSKDRGEHLSRIPTTIAGITKPSDFGGQLLDPLSDMSHCNMSDFANFLLSYESFVLPESLREEELQCWSHLRDAATHYLSLRKAGTTDKSAFEGMSWRAHKDLIAYARRVEHEFGQDMCKPNLHRMICFGHRQEEMRGPLAKDSELWIERMVQWMKRLARGRSGVWPAATMAKDTLSLM